MKFSELISGFDRHFRPIISSLSPKAAVKLYSNSRKIFLKILASEALKERIVFNNDMSVKLWDINFNCPIFNAAGMFKLGEGYYTAAMQGAGAYLAGTTTSKPREGNYKNGVRHPFASYPHSNTASNWMGLPNLGHSEIAKRISKINKMPSCPIGVSISSNPDDDFTSAIEGILLGIDLYSKAGADFIEINESCPNVSHSVEIDSASGLDLHLLERLESISSKFLKNRNTNFPCIIKLSNDTDEELIPKMIDILLDLGYDGINLGNTSTDYSFVEKQIHQKDKKLFEYFINTYGGGVSGKAVKSKSKLLTSNAAKYLSTKSLRKEFVIIRTGGIESIEDIKESQSENIQLFQWFSGYFDSYAKSGHKLYQELFK